MEELSDEQLRELEEQLYSQVHHQENEVSAVFTTLPDVAKEEEEKCEKTADNAKFLSSRYWVNQSEYNKTADKQKEQLKESKKQNLPEKDKSVQTKTRKGKEQPNMKKVRNPFATVPKHLSKRKQENANLRNAQVRKAKNFPFGRQEQQLQRAIQYENKKQKSKKARMTMSRMPENVETVVLDSSDDNDDVVIVPIPPQPIYNVDDSDDEMEAMKRDIEKRNISDKIESDAFITPMSTKNSTTSAITNEQSGDTASRCNSPNSVMSQDDFIGQTDQQRLLKTTTIADDSDLPMLTNNSDSLLEPLSLPIGKKNQNSSKDIECIGTFIKPTTSGLFLTPQSSKKQSYRVDQSGFQAMDVYESESDIVSDGVYSKGMVKSTPPTAIRNLDNSSGSDIDDLPTIQIKTKRLRKRRASENLKGSESGNGYTDSSETDEDNGVVATAVPFIARGPAVESCKSKKLRKRTLSISIGRSSHMPDTEFIATLNSLAQGSNNNDSICTDNEDVDSDSENFPSARDIAETVINQEQMATSPPDEQQDKNEAGNVDSEAEQLSSVRDISETVIEQGQITISIPDEHPIKQEEVVEIQSEQVNQDRTLEKSKCDEAVPPEIGDKIEMLFEEMQKAAKKKKEMEDIIDVCADSDTTATVQTISSEDEGDKIKYYISYAPANRFCISDGFGWNDEMARFYNYSWGGENSRVENILRNMNRDPQLWRILDSDRLMFNSRRNKKDKCLNCYTFGHTRARCPKPKKPLICYMCGESGHQEARCPNTRCLRCGNKTNFFMDSCKKCIYWMKRICPICGVRGHSLNDCPDKWRRYHSTIKPNVDLNTEVIYNKRRYCCFCGKRGHLSDECKKALTKPDYQIICSYIKSHQKSYEDDISKVEHNYKIPCRLLYNPNVNFNNGLAEKTTQNHSYGRFLCAVGLKDLIGKKSESVNFKSEFTVEIVSNQSANLDQLSGPNVSTEQVTETTEESFQASESLQMPPPLPPSQTSTVTTVDKTELPVDHDSDSNYSFSDHFEVPTTSTQRTATAPLPDFISLKNTGPEKFKENETHSSNKLLRLDQNNKPQLGISAKYVEYFPDDEDLKTPSKSSTGNKPCEAKIYISNEHSLYFQSQPGEQYLSQMMIEYNLKGSLIKTIVGYALFIHGLPADQERLQRELELKFKSLNNAKLQQAEISSKVPKNVSVLIRFLRESIKQLYTNLGNASDLCKRLFDLNNINSKSSLKSAERVRRTLNMIFLGQAGLFNGDKHMDILLTGLHTLINNFKKEEKTPENLRNKIDFSWRMLFSSHHHNYSQLLLEYMKIPPGSRNRLAKCNIDPNLLGMPNLYLNVRADQNINSNEYTNQFKTSTANSNTSKFDGPLLLNVSSGDKNQEPVHEEVMSNVEYKNQDDVNMTEEMQIGTVPSTKADEQKTIDDKLSEKHCQDILSQIAKTPKPAEKRLKLSLKESEVPSQFWSRESLKFLKELIDSVKENRCVLERLQRINLKAIAGGLSYNDYRFVLELYNVTNKINKK